MEYVIIERYMGKKKGVTGLNTISILLYALFHYTS